MFLAPTGETDLGPLSAVDLGGETDLGIDTGDMDRVGGGPGAGGSTRAGGGAGAGTGTMRACAGTAVREGEDRDTSART